MGMIVGVMVIMVAFMSSSKSVIESLASCAGMVGWAAGMVVMLVFFSWYTAPLLQKRFTCDGLSGWSVVII